MIKRMKWAMAVVLSVAFIGGASAQKIGVDWGVIAGVNMADYKVKQMDNTTSWDDVKNDLGWQVGLMASVNLGRLSIEPQLIYVRNQLKLTEKGETARIKGNSLDVPILVSYRILGPVRVMAGPVFTVMNDNSGLKGVPLDQIRSTCSYTVGLEARVLQKLRVDVRFNGQFKDKSTSIGKVDVNTFALNLGYYF